MNGVLFSAPKERWAQYRAPLEDAFAEKGLDVEFGTELAPQNVEYVIYAPNDTLSDFSGFPNLKAVMSLWAGVETIVENQTITVPLTRMVDQGLTEGMVEYVTGHVLRHHLGIDQVLAQQNGIWQKQVPPLARSRKVGILGLGALGQPCALALHALGFDVVGWSRTQRDLDGVDTVFGADGLEHMLRRSEIVVLLLPHTPTTENILDTERLAMLPDGAVVINPGRGALIDDAALLAALDRLGHATLDAFRDEPLPPADPYWSHPKVTVTPHVASETRPETASRVIAENIRRGEAGQGFLHVVDRALGY